MIEAISSINTISSALTAERTRMDVVSQNIANANTTRTPEGKVYQRQQVVFESVLAREQQAGGMDAAGVREVRVARVQEDGRSPKRVHSPGHPDADANGMVAMPDINIYEEMVDLIASSRSYQANLAAFKNARMMAMQTLSIGKRS